jgi:hypothetical protein
VTDSGNISTTAEGEALTGCLEPTDGQHLFSSPQAGYCFLMPANFERSPFNDEEGFHIGIYGPATTSGHRERGFVDVTESTTQTLEANVQAVVDEVLASMPGFTPTQISLTWGGLPAFQLEPLPGQDLQRKVYVINDGRLYVLTFLLFDENRPEATAESEELYALMQESFRFMAPTDAASSFAPLLNWEGEIDGACYTLDIQPSGEASVGVCGDDPSSTAMLDQSAEWAAVQKQFGTIDADTPAGKIIFQGKGSADSDAWAQALATWAAFTAMEINAGRTSASARTALAWQLTDTPEHSGLCSQVIVLAYGYAYANQIPCDGNGQATTVGEGWLSDAELDTFNDWLTNGGRVEGESGYLDAKGSEAVTPEEIGAWGNAVYARLLQ